MGRLFAAIFIFYTLLTTAGPGRAQVTAALPTGSLYLATLPSGADVWLDGTYVGTSPVLVDALAIGHHSVSVTKAGWTVKEVNVEIGEQTTEMQSIRLQRSSTRFNRGTGTLAVRGVNGIMHAWLDGNPIGTAVGAAAIVPVGTHTLVVQTSRGKMTRLVTIYPDMTTNVLLRETAEQRGPAILTPIVQALPDAVVSVEKNAVSIHYGSHGVSGEIGSQRVIFDGEPVWLDAAPTLISGKLYVPEALLKKLTGETSKSSGRG